MDEVAPFVSGIRSLIVKMLKEDYFIIHKDFTTTLHEKYKKLLNSINGFIVIFNYAGGQYEYVSENIKDYLGYTVTGYSPTELNNFIASIIYEKHAKIMLSVLFPTVFKYFKENASRINGTDCRYTCCVKLKNIYDKYEWYLIDTSVIQSDENGLPLVTVITCTNINQFKKDDCIYYNILKKNGDGVYEVMLENTANDELDSYKLTAREIQIVNFISQGYSNKQIANKLFITLHTVQTHRKNILKKTHCQGTAELTNFAFSRGYITP